MALNDLMMTEQPLSYGALAVYPWTRQLADQFSLKSRFGDEITLWQQLPGNRIGLPRAVCPVGANDQRSDGYKVDMKSKIIPRNADQKYAIPAVTEFMKAGQSGILQAPTGKGKTVMAIAALAAYGRSTLVVVPKDDLITQWRERLLEHTELTFKQIGIIQQDVCHYAGCPITIASLGSLAIPGRYPEDVWKCFGVVCFDEVHRLGADYFSTVCHLSSARIRLGLSATPDRSDGKDIVFRSHIGPTRVKLETSDTSFRVLRYTSKWRCPRQKKGGEIVIVPHSANKAGHIENHLVKDEGRNMLLTYMAVSAYKKKRHTVLFSSRTEHLKDLEALMVKAGVPRSDIGHYYGSQKPETLKAAGVRPIVLATYGKMAEGTDIPSLDCCILATPRSNVVQCIGRIRRELPDKPLPVVFDVDDRDSPVFGGYKKGRQKFYKKEEAEIVEMEWVDEGPSG
jgi:superfamily II DNA or RNA helicase